MTEPVRDPSEQADHAETLSPEIDAPGGALSVPPPVPQKEPGFFRRLFMSRQKQQAIAVQNGYLEMVDLIRAIRCHLDRQETVQTSLLTMLQKVPDAMDRQQEVLGVFKQQLENNMENDRRLTDSMGRLSGTLDAMNESHKTSSRTIADLIGRTRESEQLLREVMRRSERRMTILIVFFVLLVLGTGYYLTHWQNRARTAPEASPAPALAVAVPAEAPAPAAEAPAPEPEPAPEAPAAAPETEPEPETAPAAAEAPAEPAAETEAAESAPPGEEHAEKPAEDSAVAPAEAPKAATIVEASAEKEPKAKSRSRAKAKPGPAADAPAEAPAPAEEPPPAQPEPAAAEPAPTAEDLALFQLKAAIGDAVLDAFAAKGHAPVSLP